jgi:hypothetical protein
MPHVLVRHGKGAVAQLDLDPMPRDPHCAMSNASERRSPCGYTRLSMLAMTPSRASAMRT